MIAAIQPGWAGEPRLQAKTKTTISPVLSKVSTRFEN